MQLRKITIVNDHSVIKNTNFMEDEMEFSKWARKLVRELEDCDFEMQKAKGTSHRQFKYTGSEMDFPDIVTVPVKIKGTSQIRSIATINQKLKKYNAPKAIIDRFQNIAMGMLTVENGDDIDTIEEKIYEALISNNIIAVSELTAYLQILAIENNLMPYLSKSVTKYKNEIKLNNEKLIYINAINNNLLKIFQTAIKVYIDEHGCVEVGSLDIFKPSESFSFDCGKTSNFGIDIKEVRQNRWDAHFTVYGLLKSPLTDVLSNLDSQISFDLTLDNDDGEKYAIYHDNQSFYGFNVNIEHHLLEDIKVASNKLEKHITLFLLKHNLS